MWSFPFIPSFAVQPPAVTATHLYAPDFTNAAASISACVGAAQNPLASDPDALTSPATSAAAFLQSYRHLSGSCLHMLPLHSQ